jgi:hypothetical protein
MNDEPMRVRLRVWVEGELRLEEQPTDHEETIRRLPEIIGLASLHMVELEFLDEPDPLQRFYRFGTDPRRMVRPRPVIPKREGAC